MLFLILFFIMRKLFDGRDGGIFFSYLILYSSLRLVIESIRIDSVLNISGVPAASVISILIIGISAGFLYYTNRKREC